MPHADLFGTVLRQCIHRAVYGGGLLLLLIAGCSGPRDAAPEGGEAPPRTPPPAETPKTPTERTVDGFRIQVFTSTDKAEADAQAAEAERWWAGMSAGARPEGMQQDEAPVLVAWRQPYYRVRIGTFATRAEAERALPLLRQQFGTAFVVPDRVTVVR